MDVKSNRLSGGREQLEKAFTLIELIGVLAVIAILAAIIVPNLLHQLDITAGQQEVAALQGLGNALQSSVCRNFYIPGANDWASNIAAELGTGTPLVAPNSRGLPRVFLIDPNFQIGTNAVGALPYTQNINGSVSNAVSPRLMILTSIGNALPPTPNLATNFANIWNTADGTVPTGFSGWTANNASDLKVQRINLSPLFVQLLLSTYSSPTNGLYAINPATSSATSNAPYGGGVAAYYIKNTVLRLINAPSLTVDSDQILSQNSSFVYNLGVWRNSINTGGAGLGSAFFDFDSIAAGFLAAPANTNASGGATQPLVVQDLINFLNAYDAWAAWASANNNWSTSGSLYNTAFNDQSIMMNDVYNLINGL